MNVAEVAGLSALSSRVWKILGALVFAAALLIQSGAGFVSAAPNAVQLDDTHFIGDQFMFELRWEAPWEVNPDTAESIEGQYDRVVVVGPDGAVQCLMMFGRDLEGTLDGAIDARADIYDDFEVVEWSEGNNAIGLPFVGATLSYGVSDGNGNSVDLLEYLEVSPGYTIDLGDAVAVISIAAPAESFGAAFDDAQESLQFNEGMFGALFAGLPVVDGGGSHDQSGPDDEDSRDQSGPDDGLTEDQYLLILENEIAALNAGVEGFYNLINDPNFGDDQSLGELSAILNSWIEAYDYAQTIEPPSGYEDVHDAYLNFSGVLAQAAVDLFDGDFDSAVANLEFAQDLAASLADSLEQPNVIDLLDRKSG